MYTMFPLPLTPMRWPSATEIPIMMAGEPEAWRLSVDAKTQRTNCRVNTSSTATAWPFDTLLRTWAKLMLLPPGSTRGQTSCPTSSFMWGTGCSPCRLWGLGMKQGGLCSGVRPVLQRLVCPAHPLPGRGRW